MTTPTPSCCTPLEAHWPFCTPLAGTCLVSTRFDHALLDLADYARLGLSAPQAVTKRQAEYLAGRSCAHEALRRLTGQGALVGSDAERAPLWPSGCVGSITHGKGWAGALVGEARHWAGLGLDVEGLIAPARADRLAAEILTPAEARGYAELPEAQRSLVVTRAFSLKESLFKALFPLVRRRFWFHDAALVDFSEDSACLRLLTDLAADWPAGSELHGQLCQFDGYLLSLVTVPHAGKKLRPT